MKNIHQNLLFSIKATSQKSGFPAENLLDKHPKKKWKGLNRIDTLTLSVGPGGSGILIGNTNAESAEASINGADVLEFEAGVEFESTVEWEPYLSTELGIIDLSVGNPGEMWIEYTAAASSHEVHITLTAPIGSTAYGGVAGAGVLNSFSDPVKGFKEGQKDYSLVRPLNNGGTYTKKKDVVRTFSGEISLDRNPDFYAIMDIFKDIGPDPIPWRLSTSITDREWIVYARRESSPSGIHEGGGVSRATISLIEVL